MTHTPGPWTVGLNNPDGDDPYGPIPIKAKHTTIAKLWLDDAPVHDFNAMQRCNAKLIAAAPDLLEALELADATLRGANMNRNIVERKVAAALAKAKV